MNDIVVRLAVFAVVGLVIGYVSALFGMGGGIIRIPVFLYLFPLFGVAHPVLMHMSIGTSLSLVIPTSVESTWSQYKARNLDVTYYKTWALGVSLGIVIGMVLLPFCSTEVLQVIFIIFLASVGTYFWLVPDNVVIAHRPPQGFIKIAIATAIGLGAALTGTAGGTFTTPTMRAFEMQIKKAIALASATGVVTGFVATAGAILQGWNAAGRPVHSLGFIDVTVFVAMTPTTLAGAMLGARTANRLSKEWLKHAYTLVVYVMAADMVRQMLS
jgi:uncharacterized membrane protein YfcA